MCSLQGPSAALLPVVLLHNMQQAVRLSGEVTQPGCLCSHTNMMASSLLMSLHAVLLGYALWQCVVLACWDLPTASCYCGGYDC